MNPSNTSSLLLSPLSTASKAIKILLYLTATTLPCSQYSSRAQRPLARGAHSSLTTRQQPLSLYSLSRTHHHTPHEPALYSITHARTARFSRRRFPLVPRSIRNTPLKPYYTPHPLLSTLTPTHRRQQICWSLYSHLIPLLLPSP